MGAWGAGAGGLVVGGLGGFGGGGLGVAQCGFLWVLLGAHCNTTFFLQGCCALPILSPASLFLFPCPLHPCASSGLPPPSLQNRWKRPNGF